MRTLLVVAHPRPNSLTCVTAQAFAAALRARDWPVEWADLAREGFDPDLGAADEPDWNGSSQRFSPAVQAEMERIRRNEATVLVFPVWWWSVPALLKGWIDRVWNLGFAYGGQNYPQRRVWMLGLAGTSAEAYAKRGYDAAMRTQLETGVLEYCGVPERRLEILYGTLEGGAAAALERAAALGREFAATPGASRR